MVLRLKTRESRSLPGLQSCEIEFYSSGQRLNRCVPSFMDLKRPGFLVKPGFFRFLIASLTFCPPLFLVHRPLSSVGASGRAGQLFLI
jgi:hypothetical protein